MLNPDQNNRLLRLYHISSKGTIPLILTSMYCGYVGNKYENYAHSLNILNFGYHSYVSTSAVITDYIKIKNIEKMARITNVKVHGLATLGLLMFIHKKK